MELIGARAYVLDMLDARARKWLSMNTSLNARPVGIITAISKNCFYLALDVGDAPIENNSSSMSKATLEVTETHENVDSMHLFNAEHTASAEESGGTGFRKRNGRKRKRDRLFLQGTTGLNLTPTSAAMTTTTKPVPIVVQKSGPQIVVLVKHATTLGIVLPKQPSKFFKYEHKQQREEAERRNRDEQNRIKQETSMRNVKRGITQEDIALMKEKAAAAAAEEEEEEEEDEQEENEEQEQEENNIIDNNEDVKGDDIKNRSIGQNQSTDSFLALPSNMNSTSGMLFAHNESAEGGRLCVLYGKQFLPACKFDN
jgi:hypothetical protein